ncbi:MAG: hypothetical protein IKG47_10805 [Oscillospiraceae bacterium]|nr:hypothetical protein [Oscillospiraceae bacterium]
MFQRIKEDIIYTNHFNCWCSHEEQAQRHFLLSQVDAIITDNVYQANDIIKELSERGDVARFFDAIIVGSDPIRSN